MKKVTILERSLYRLMGIYGSDHCYNVWFSRRNNGWVICMNKCPKSGNLRSSD